MPTAIQTYGKIYLFNQQNISNFAAKPPSLTLDQYNDVAVTNTKKKFQSQCSPTYVLLEVGLQVMKTFRKLWKVYCTKLPLAGKVVYIPSWSS